MNLIEKIKELIFWNHGRVFSIDRELGEIVIRTKDDFHKIYYDATTQEAGMYVGESVKYRLIKDADRKRIMVRCYE